MHIPTIRTVFFDLDNTLFDHTFAERRAIEVLFEVFATALSPYHNAGLSCEAFVRAYRVVNERLWLAMSHGNIRPAELKTERFVQTFEHLLPLVPRKHFEHLGEKMGAVYLQYYQDFWHLVPHAEEAITAAERVARVGIISNGFKEQQHKKLERFGWSERFAAVVLSSEVGVMKPLRGIFDAALHRLALSADEVLYVGDSYENDIEGASNAGWRSVWYNPHKLQRPDNLATWTISSLQELTALLHQEPTNDNQQ
jgi:putative hydrolase of the HAD superfamily